MNKTILMILNQKFLPDRRVEKEYEVLINQGYRVVVLASDEGHDSDKFEIIRLKSLNNLATKIRSKLFLVDRQLVQEIMHELSARNLNTIDYIHVHDLNWAFLGFELKKKLNSKVVLDLHENYPALRRDYSKQLKFGLKTLAIKVIYNYHFLKWYESELLSKSDGFICVGDESLDLFKGKSFYDKGTVVSNTKSPNEYDLVDVPSIDDEFIITYMGTIQNFRGIETAIKGMAQLDNRYKLNVVGVQPEDPYSQVLYRTKNECNAENVNLVEWLTDETEINRHIVNSHICVVPHEDTETTQTAIPNKIFIYMAYGRPILVSDVRPLKRIVDGSDAGLVFEAGNADDFAKRVREMDNHSRLVEWGSNGRNAIERVYNWDKDAERLENLYKGLERG